MNKIVKEGDFSGSLEIERNTEAGDIAIVFNRMVQELKSIAEVAERVSHGDLRVNFQPKHENDQLGKAIKLVVEILANKLKLSSENIENSINFLQQSNDFLQTSNNSAKLGANKISQNVSKILI